MLLEISEEITLERMKGWSQSKNNSQLWMRLVIEAENIKKRWQEYTELYKKELSFMTQIITMV